MSFVRTGYILGTRKYKKIRGPEGFATASGKLELASSVLEKLGGDPLPFYEETAGVAGQRPGSL